MDENRKRGREEDDSPSPTHRRLKCGTPGDDSGFGDKEEQSSNSPNGGVIPVLLDTGSDASILEDMVVVAGCSMTHGGGQVPEHTIPKLADCDSGDESGEIALTSWAMDLPRLLLADTSEVVVTDESVCAGVQTGQVDFDDEDVSWEKTSGSAETSDSDSSSDGDTVDTDAISSDHGSNQGGGFQIVQHLMGNSSIDEDEASYIMGIIPLPRLPAGHVLDFVDVNAISTNEVYQRLLPGIVAMISSEFVRRVPEFLRNLPVFNLNVAGVNAVFQALRDFILSVDDDSQTLNSINLMEFLQQAVEVWFGWDDDRDPRQRTEASSECQGCYGRMSNFITDEMLGSYGLTDAEGDISSDKSGVNSSGSF